EPDELKAIKPASTKQIDLLAVIPAGQFDQLLVQRSYYLIPSKLELGKRAYTLVADVLQELEAVVLGRFTWRTENLCAIRPHDRVLLLHTLLPAEDLRPADDIVDELDGIRPLDRETKLGRQLIRRLLADYTPDVLTD